MNIWIINPAAAPPREGTGTRHFDFARRLAARNHDVTLVASSVSHLGGHYEALGEVKTARIEVIEGLRFVWLPGISYAGNGARRLWGMLDTARRIWSGRELAELPSPDVIIGSSPHPFGAFGAMLLARRMRVPFVLEIRDVWPASIITTGKLRPWNPLILLLAWMERALYSGAKQIITLLPGTPNHIVRHGGRRDRITWISNGADLERAGLPRPQPDRTGLQIVYIGTVGLWYGIDTAIEAMALIKDHPEAQDISLTFIGGGTEEARLRADCEARGLSSVRFFARIPKAEVSSRLAEYDACMAIVKDAPLYREGGVALNKLFDYLAAGRPILFSSSAFNDPVADACAGYTSPGGDAAALAQNILKLAAATTAERASMGANGRAHVAARYDFDTLTLALEEVLEKARCGDHAPGGPSKAA